MKYAKRGGKVVHDMVMAVPTDRWVTAKEINQLTGDQYGSALIASWLNWKGCWGVDRRLIKDGYLAEPSIGTIKWNKEAGEP